MDRVHGGGDRERARSGGRDPGSRPRVRDSTRGAEAYFRCVLSGTARGAGPDPRRGARLEPGEKNYRSARRKHPGKECSGGRRGIHRADPRGAGWRRGMNVRVLLIEDEPAVAMTLSDLLAGE